VPRRCTCRDGCERSRLEAEKASRILNAKAAVDIETIDQCGASRLWLENPFFRIRRRGHREQRRSSQNPVDVTRP
jgi:hypothetical protein